MRHLNYKALALGMVLGFIFAVAPSCGNSATTCGAANCNTGCCDSAGKCVTTPSNANNSSCGTSGNACVDCTKSSKTCNNFVCGTGSAGGGAGGGTAAGGGAGGGTAAGGGAGGGTGGAGVGGGTSACGSCSGGCCAGSQCLQASLQGKTNCGNNGQACVACATGQNCTNGVCTNGAGGGGGSGGGTGGGGPVTSADGGNGLGDPCNTAADCFVLAAFDAGSATGGGPVECKTAQLSIVPTATGPAAVAGAPYAQGYCTRRCYDGAQCGPQVSGQPESHCGFFMGLAGEAENICYKGCGSNGECRPGYVCLNVGYPAPTVGLCTPVNQPDGGWDQFDAGPPPAPGVVGADCASDSTCNAQQPLGRCNSGTQADGGPSGFGAGYCTADCTMNPDNDFCGSIGDGGSICSPQVFNDPGGPLVLWECRSGCGGASTVCKTGYHCESDPYQAKVCEVDCDVTPNECATGCHTSWGCFNAMCVAATHDCQ